MNPAIILAPLVHISEYNGIGLFCKNCPEFNVELSILKESHAGSNATVCYRAYAMVSVPASTTHPSPPLCHNLKQVTYLRPALLYPFYCTSRLVICFKWLKLL